jgi:2-haloalkanoic acid dehalogenase type II
VIFLFDCFGTIFDISNVPIEDLRYYAKVLHAPAWEPLVFPASWNDLRPHLGAFWDIRELREAGHTVAALSNAPSAMMAELSAKNEIEWDKIIPLEKYRIYKPNPLAYLTACAELDCRPSECVMVSANKTFGDLEASRLVGMRSIFLDRKQSMTIADLPSYFKEMK